MQPLQRIDAPLLKLHNGKADSSRRTHSDPVPALGSVPTASTFQPFNLSTFQLSRGLSPLLCLNWLENGAKYVISAGAGANRDRGGGMDHEVVAADEPAGEAR